MPFFAPGQPDYNHLRHMILAAFPSTKSPTLEEILCQVAHLPEPGGKPDRWFYDAFLEFGPAPSGNALYADVNLGTTRSGDGDFYAVLSPNPGRAVDWTGYLDNLFAPGGYLALLDKAVGVAARTLGPPPSPRSVVLSVPYPAPNQSFFGPVRRGGPSLNFSVTGQNLMKASEQRLEACRWFVRQCEERWKKAGFRNLAHLGYYWIYESLHYSWDVDDHWVLKEFYKVVRSRRSRVFWIPFYSSFNVNLLEPGRGFYFDCAFLQPNHVFYHKIPGVGKAAREAAERGAGMEMEYYINMDPRWGVGREKYRRFRNYLDGGVKYGYMTESACAYFMGGFDVPLMLNSPDKRERELYHDLADFVGGEYKVKGRSRGGDDEG